MGSAVEWGVRTYARRIVPFAGLTLLLVAPVTITTSLFADVRITGNVVGTAQSFLPLVFDDGPAWLLALKVVSQLFLWPAYLVVLTRIAVGAYLGEKLSFSAMLRQGLFRWRSMLWISLLVAIVYLAVGAIVLAASLLAGALASERVGYWVGTVLGIPLLVFFSTRLAFAELLLIAEGRRGRIAIGRSWLLTEGRLWQVVGAILVASFLAIVVNFGIRTVAGLFTDASPSDPDLVLAVGVAAGQLFTTPFFVLVVTAMFFACIADERAFDPVKQLRYVHALDR
ncbi:MAG: hypothetical protein WEF05_04110 [Actinomycetota bacterium]